MLQGFLTLCVTPESLIHAFRCSTLCHLGRENRHDDDDDECKVATEVRFLKSPNLESKLILNC